MIKTSLKLVYKEVNIDLYFIFGSVFFHVPRAVYRIQTLNTIIGLKMKGKPHQNLCHPNSTKRECIGRK